MRLIGISVLFVCGVDGGPLFFDRIFEQIRRGEEAWHLMGETDHLASLSATLPKQAALIRRVCSKVTHHEERWMCERRGAAIQARLSPYKSVSTLDAQRVIDEHESYNTDEAGVRIYIRNGAIHSWENIQGRGGSLRIFTASVVGKVLEGLRGGTALPHFTFELLILFQDTGVCRNDPLRPTAVYNSTGPPGYPISKYSVNAKGCSHFIALPDEESIQHDALRKEMRFREWNDLDGRVVFRGTNFNRQRLLMSALAQTGWLAPLLDIGITAMFGEEHCVTDLQSASNVPFPDTTDFHTLCHSSISGVTKPYLTYDEIMTYRYVLVIDGIGSAIRFPHHMKGPGIVLHMPREEEMMVEYWFNDMVPWVHYVPLTQETDKMVQNFSETLEFLEANPEVAKRIALESTRWANLHKTDRTDHRQWKLYYYLLDDLWDGSAEAVVPPRTVSCDDGLAELTNDVHIGDAVISRTCLSAGLSLGLLNESEDPLQAAKAQLPPERYHHIPISDTLPIDYEILQMQRIASDNVLALRDASLQRRNRMERTDHLADLSRVNPTQAEAVRSVCKEACGVVWICHARGARIARSLQAQHHHQISRSSSTAFVAAYTQYDPPGLRIFIRNGKLNSWETLSDTSIEDPKYASILTTLCKALHSADLVYTVDLLVLFDHNASCTRKRPSAVHNPDTPAVHPYVLSGVSTSMSLSLCAPGVAMPFEDLPEGVGQGLSLQPRLGYIGNEPTTLSTILKVLAYTGWQNGSVVDLGVVPDNEEHCVAQIKAVRGLHVLPLETLARTDAKICENRTPPPNSTMQTGQPRYIIASDGSPTTLLSAMREPNVVPLYVAGRSEYFSADLLPWVHYVPITDTLHDVVTNLSRTLHILHENPDLSAAIATTSTEFALQQNRDNTDRTQWLLYVSLAGSIWDDAVPSPSLQQAVNCTQHDSPCHKGGGSRGVVGVRMGREGVWENGCAAVVSLGVFVVVGVKMRCMKGALFVLSCAGVVLWRG